MTKDDEGNQQPGITGFDLKAAWGECRTDWKSGTKSDIAASGAKFFGKALVNLGIGVAKEAPRTLKRFHEDREKLKSELEAKSNRDLYDIYQGYKASNDSVRAELARMILKERRQAERSEKPSNF